MDCVKWLEVAEFMELKRKVYQKLLDWKIQSNGKTAILIEGARRIGKSHIAEYFGKEEYKSYIIVDFSRINPQIIDVFENDIMDLNCFFEKLSLFYGVKLYERDSLIIFDEVQLYPKARQLIKHLVADGRFDYLETGSLITLKKNTKDIVIPSEEECINMYPLDFEEFLWAQGDDMTYDYVRRCFEKQVPLGEAIHRKVMNMFRRYMLVGGMPQAVIEYLEHNDFESTDKIKRQILKLYRDDVTKFADGYESKVLAIFDGVPSQLSKHEKKYKLSSLKKEAKFRDYEDSFMWLDDAKVINVCFNSCDPNVGLRLNEDRLTLKCYMADTGLLFSHTFSDTELTEDEIYKAILFDSLSINEGMFLENIVAQMLVSRGYHLFFYSRNDREDKNNRMEIDFLIRKGKKICPLEVKSSAYNKHSSLDKFANKFSGKVGNKFIVYTKDLKCEDDIVYLPIYMMLCL